jgi:hypothetical protein
LSSFVEPTSQDTEASETPILETLVAVLIAMKLHWSKNHRQPVDQPAAAALISGAARFYRGGLRWVAWAIHFAKQRTVRVESWAWIRGTLAHWQAGDGAPPDDWPPDPSAVALKPARPLALDPPEPPESREELDARIAELKAMPRRLLEWEQIELKQRQAAREALDQAYADPGGSEP